MKRPMLIALAATLAGASLIASSAARASATGTPMNEVEGFTRSLLEFGSGKNTKFSIGAGYSRTLMEILQGTTEVAFSVESGLLTLEALVGPTLNLAIDDTGIRNSVYLALLGGIELDRLSPSGGTSTTHTHFAYKIALGKRFEFWPEIAWKPEFFVAGTAGAGKLPVYTFVPAQFAFTF
jgi:hypothetical protein